MEACGVWQNTQTRLSAVAFKVPGPLVERLCLVLTMSSTPAETKKVVMHNAMIKKVLLCTVLNFLNTAK